MEPRNRKELRRKSQAAIELRCSQVGQSRLEKSLLAAGVAPGTPVS